MDKRSKIFLFIFFIFIAFIVAFSFYKYYILEDYYLKIKVSCNPKSQNCFASLCDPSQEENCSAKESKIVNYHKFIYKKANVLSVCAEKCALTCKPKEDCEEILCNDADLGEGEWCSARKDNNILVE